MSSSPDPFARPASPPIHWPSLLQFGGSILAIVNLLGGAAMLVVVGLAGIITQSPELGDPLPFFLMSAGLLASSVLLAPSTGYAWQRLTGKPIQGTVQSLHRLRPELWIAIFPLVLALGFGISKLPALAWLLLPPLHVLAVGLPVGWLLYVGIRRLPTGSPQRWWGVLGSGMVLGPFIIMFFELAAGLVFVSLAAVAISTQPDLVQKLTRFSQWVINQEPTPEMLIQVVGPYLTNPWFIAAMLSFVAVVVPLIEELFKPIGVWLLVGKRLTPAAGFAAGALSGAGYAFFESLALASNGGEWGSLMVARVGTSVIHILTTGLTGWGLASAWSKKRYLRLGGTYLLAVALHSSWNALTVFTAVTSTAGQISTEVSLPPVLDMAGKIAPILLAALATFGLLLLFWANRKLAAPVYSQPDATPAELIEEAPLTLQSAPEPSEPPTENML